MPVLKNAKHERVAQGLAEGKSATQAYVDAGYSAKSANANSSTLMAEHGQSILERRDEILGSRVARIEENHSLEQHLSKLAALRDKAEQLGKMGDAISAEVSRGRALGYYIERRESGAAGAFQAKTREEADKQLEDTIARIAAKQAIEKAKQKA